MILHQGKVYRFKGVTFEFHRYLGPVMLRRKSLKEKNWRTVGRRQWAIFAKWFGLSAEQREQYRINP